MIRYVSEEDDTNNNRSRNSHNDSCRKIIPFANQSLESIRNRLSGGSLFIDYSFLPGSESLGSRDRQIKWIRACELTSNPKMIVEGLTRFDVNQGELGDCWVLSSLASLTLHPHLIDNIVPTGQGFGQEYHGLFHFRFWQYGSWVEVVVDDYLPTVRGKLVYLRSTDENEFWAPLLEKAYAKLKGSYEMLKGGNMIESMVDFTGGVGTLHEFKETGDDFPKVLVEASQSGAIIGASVPSVAHSTVANPKLKCGLVAGHAYSVTKVVSFVSKGKTVYLLRLRNPWGDETEWNGAWSDGSQEWDNISSSKKAELNVKEDSDGEFYMSYDEVKCYFDRIEILRFLKEDDWNRQEMHGAWTPQSGGGCRNYPDTFGQNPQYKFVINNDTQCFVSLIQKNTRNRDEGTTNCLAIGFYIYKLEHEDTQRLDSDFFKYNLSCGRSSFSNLSEMADVFSLAAGSYVVVPATFYPGEEAQFFLRIFTKK